LIWFDLVGFTLIRRSFGPPLCNLVASLFKQLRRAKKIKHYVFPQPTKTTALARENRVKKGEKRMKNKRNPRKPRDLRRSFKTTAHQRFPLRTRYIA
jgi:hypothetical protein